LEACNYDDTRLVTSDQLLAEGKKSLSNLSLKNITLLGIVKTPSSKSKRRGTAAGGSRKRKRRNSFIEAEAAEGSEESEEVVAKEKKKPLQYLKTGFCQVQETRESFALDRSRFDGRYRRNVASLLCQGDYRAWKNYGACQPGEVSLGYCGNARGRDPEFERNKKLLLYQTRWQQQSQKGEEEEEVGDLAEGLVKHLEEHSYADSGKTLTESSELADYKFLYALSVSGERKKVNNTIQRAVAVLGNSKKLFSVT